MSSVHAASHLYRTHLVGALGDDIDDTVRPRVVSVCGHHVQMPECLSVGFGVVIVDDTVLPLARPTQYPLFQLLVQPHDRNAGEVARAGILTVDAALCCLKLLASGQTFADLPLRRQAEVGNILRKAICRLRAKLIIVGLQIGTVAARDKRIIGYMLLPEDSDQVGATSPFASSEGPSLVEARGSTGNFAPPSERGRPISRLHAR